MRVATAGGASAGQPAAALPCFVVNPRSFRASRWRLAQRASALVRRSGLEVFEASTLQQFRATLDLLCSRRQEQIWLLAGDGTIHAIAQYMSELDCDWSPAFLLLGGGRANIVPRDCGGYPPMKRLRAALSALHSGRALSVERLPTLRIEQADRSPQFGFMLAGAMIHEGIRYCSEHRARGTGWLHRSWLADPWCLLKLAFLVLIGRSPLPPYEILELRAGETATLRAPVRVLVVSSLQFRDALYNPFAARGQGAVRLTAVAASALHFWRNLPALLGGKFGPQMNPEHGYLSGRFGHVEIRGMSGYALDGESFNVAPPGALRLSGGIELRVLRA